MTDIYYYLHRSNRAAVDVLYVRVRWSGKIISASLGYQIDRDGWDQQAQICCSRSTHGADRVPAQRINNDIKRLTDRLRAVMTDPLPSPAAVRKAIVDCTSLAEVPDKKMISTADLYAAYLQEQSTIRGWGPGTISNYTGMGNTLITCGLFTDLALVDESTLIAYVDYLKAQDLTDRYIAGVLGQVKRFLSWCCHRGLIKAGTWDNISLRTKGNVRPVIYLTWDELMTLWRSGSWSQSYRYTLDVFLFCCFTGLRYSDAIELKWSQVHDDHIDVVTHKTTKLISIELNQWSIDILTRYMEEGYPDDRVFYWRLINTANTIIKSIAKQCQISDPVMMVAYRGGHRVERIVPKYEVMSTHCARRTFVCNALKLGIPPEVVMTWTGHSSLNAMTPYIGVDDTTKAQQMSKLNNV